MSFDRRGVPQSSQTATSIETLVEVRRITQLHVNKIAHDFFPDFLLPNLNARPNILQLNTQRARVSSKLINTFTRFKQVSKL